MNAVKGPIYSPLSISIKANTGRKRANFLYGNLLTFPISSFTKSWWFGGQSKASVRRCSWSTKGHLREEQTPPNLPSHPKGAGSISLCQTTFITRSTVWERALCEMGDASQVQQARKIQS